MEVRLCRYGRPISVGLSHVGQLILATSITRHEDNADLARIGSRFVTVVAVFQDRCELSTRRTPMCREIEHQNFDIFQAVGICRVAAWINESVWLKERLNGRCLGIHCWHFPILLDQRSPIKKVDWLAERFHKIEVSLFSWFLCCRGLSVYCYYAKWVAFFERTKDESKVESK